ncbi:MAG: 50S ribosomal protein L7/L12 [Candidatus Moranbacteria bacterium GW2011_GWE1_49_15]|nr:MAG: 50S ribosomal protein L7/L12 [Candidatus Moranbacteria bacterium GW2011_GWE1_49_15]
MHHNDFNDADKSHKIDSLRDMILNAEKTIQSAKAMLLQLEGKKKTGRKRKIDADAGDGEIIEGTFDGQIMLGTNGKQYPVPANYASKSKLVEGDMLKLTITPDGSFVYKQIGPIERRHMIGIVSQDEKGNYYIFSEGKPYKVLLASITYFKAQPGDEVAILTPREIDSSWAAIENVLQKGAIAGPRSVTAQAVDKEIETWKKELESPEPEEVPREDETPQDKPSASAVVDEWTSDIADLEKEIKAQNPSF